ncbi:adenylate kinase [Actinomyces minihominis]|uniref:adenylate kinase n=1 Tax=Actinomyces minihominis TaxID=2002838 RepID=UPI000C07055A|nr:adenylate kinase [Actinomyces minihominis]
MTRVIFLGPPAVGKGTQATWLAEKLGIPTVSTGQIFRSNIDEGTELGRLADSYISRGKFVPDSITVPMVDARLSAPDVEDGFILDGFPRNLNQAHALRDLLAKRGVSLDVVIELEAPEEVVVERLQMRAGIEKRSDDRVEVFVQRLQDYHELTEPIATYYADQDLLEVVDAAKTREEIHEDILAVLSSKGLCSK